MENRNSISKPPKEAPYRIVIPPTFKGFSENQTKLETLRGDDVQRGSDRRIDGGDHEPARLERVSGYIRANDLERFQNVKEDCSSIIPLWKLGCYLVGEDEKDLNRIMMLNDPAQQPTLQSQQRKRYLQQRFSIRTKSTAFVQIPPLSHLGRSKKTPLRWCFRDKIFVLRVVVSMKKAA